MLVQNCNSIAPQTRVQWTRCLRNTSLLTHEFGTSVPSSWQPKVKSQNCNSIAPQTRVQLTRCLRKTSLLTHEFGTICAIVMATESEEWSEQQPSGATKITCSRSGTSVIRRSRVPLRAWVGPITNQSQLDTVAKSRAETQWRFDGDYGDGHSDHPQTLKRHLHPQPAAIDVGKH